MTSSTASSTSLAKSKGRNVPKKRLGGLGVEGGRRRLTFALGHCSMRGGERCAGALCDLAENDLQG
jgi:hypothetical protein